MAELSFLSRKKWKPLKKRKQKAAKSVNNNHAPMEWQQCRRDGNLIKIFPRPHPITHRLSPSSSSLLLCRRTLWEWKHSFPFRTTTKAHHPCSLVLFPRQGESRCFFGLLIVFIIVFGSNLGFWRFVCVWAPFIVLNFWEVSVAIIIITTCSCRH